jgi:hypothetical protein
MKVIIPVLLLLATPVLADVYKTVTPDGEVIYSDVKTQGAKQFNVPKTQVYTPPPLPVRVNQPVVPKEKALYSSFAIDSPVNEETIRDNLGNIPLLLTLEPGLIAKDGHRIQYFLDGKPHGRPTVDTEKTFTNVDRGEHQVSAAVVDNSGTPIINTPPVTVFVQQASLQNPYLPRDSAGIILPRKSDQPVNPPVRPSPPPTSP